MEVLARDSMLRGAAIVTMHVFYQIAARMYSYAFVMILKREQKANVYTYIASVTGIYLYVWMIC